MALSRRGIDRLSNRLHRVRRTRVIYAARVTPVPGAILKGNSSWEIKARTRRNRIAANSSLARFPLSRRSFLREKASVEIFQLTRAFDTFSTCRRLSYLLRAYRNTREREMLSSAPSGTPFDRVEGGIASSNSRTIVVSFRQLHYRGNIAIMNSYCNNQSLLVSR